MMQEQRHSIRTRIKTHFDTFYTRHHSMSKDIPLEQGLRHFFYHTVNLIDCSEQRHSIRTRIKTQSRIDPNRRAHKTVVIPLEQGLRRIKSNEILRRRRRAKTFH